HHRTFGVALRIHPQHIAGLRKRERRMDRQVVARRDRHRQRAVMGGIMCAQAAASGIAGVVIDGAVRDAAELRQGLLPVFAAAISPAGP
ncbi:hypothetical protein LLE87_34115, partial [Paenibacillus polymyxa]|nr:hypothetical protein [Paenibacillus polymyxa]